MLGYSLPFDDREIEEVIDKKIVSEEPPYKGSLWKKISNETKDFINKLLVKNPEKRMNNKEALEYEWFKKFDDNDVVMARRVIKDIRKKEFELYSNNTKSEVKKNLWFGVFLRIFFLVKIFCFSVFNLAILFFKFLSWKNMNSF